MTQKDIYLRTVELEDADILSKWFNNKENIKYMSTIIRCKPHSKESVKNEIENYDDNYEKLFMVYLKGFEKPIGHIGIDDIDFDDRRAEIFFLLGEKEDKGKGYGIAMARLLLDYAFNKLKLNSLFASSTVDNKPAISILENVGFKRIGIRRQYNYINKKFYDEIFFDITREDYDNSKYE